MVYHKYKNGLPEKRWKLKLSNKIFDILHIIGDPQVSLETLKSGAYESALSPQEYVQENAISLKKI